MITVPQRKLHHTQAENMVRWRLLTALEILNYKAVQMLTVYLSSTWPGLIPKGYKGEGNIIVFNNGNQSRGSSVDEYKLPVDSEGKYDMKKKPEKVWSYAPSNFYASNMGSAQRLENGNTLICQGPSGTILEVNERKEIVWKYISPVTNNSIVRQGQSVGGGFGMALNQCFRAWRYSPDYEAFEGKNLKIPSPS